jgi:hypothetical protein
VSTLGATYAGQGGRQNALAINRAVQYHVRRRVELPPETSVVRAPGAFEVRTGPLEASRTFAAQPIAATPSQSGGKVAQAFVLEEHFRLGVSTGTVPADKYGDFVQAALKADSAFLASIRVRPPRPEPKKP